MLEGHVIDLLPSYALGVTNEEERKQVLEHLIHCKTCQDELHSYTRVVDALPLAVKTIQPPLKLKQRVISKVREGRQPEIPSGERQIWDSFRKFFTLKAPIWGAASLLLVLVLFVSNLFLWQRLNVLESVSQNTLITVELQGTDFKPDAAGMLVMSNDGDYGVLIVDGLPELKNSEQYQLWLISNGVRSNGGIFSVNEGGYGSLLIAASKPLSEYDSFGITVEPKGGSPGPTGIKVLGS